MFTVPVDVPEQETFATTIVIEAEAVVSNTDLAVSITEPETPGAAALTSPKASTFAIPAGFIEKVTA
jgi:hypothetical protein